MENDIQGALSNLKILDLTRVLAGPFCTMILADMGADVIKIEMPERGDDSRNYPPFVEGESLYYANINRSKKSITLNLKSEEGKKIFFDFVKSADIVVENYRPGVMDRLGLGYDMLKEVNEGIIYAAVSGFGSYGQYSQKPGYDIIGQAMGGLMSVTGWPETGPTRSGNAMGDVLGGMNLAIGILAAVNNRNMTGKGQKVDVSLVDSVVASLEICLQRYIHSGEQPELLGNRYTSIYPYDAFAAKDGKYVLGCGNQKLWELFCKAIGHEEYIKDDRFLTGAMRVDSWRDLKTIINEWSKDYTVDEIVNHIDSYGVPVAPIFDFKRLLADEHIAHDREMFVSVKHPIIGDMKVGGCAIKLMGTKNHVRWPAPTLGEHNSEVYKEVFSFTEEDFKKLSDKKII